MKTNQILPKLLLTKFSIKDPKLLQQVFTHKSLKEEKKNNETLEFLGDAVLNLIIAEFLMESRPQASESYLSKQRSMLVSGKTLAQIALDLSFPKLLKTASQDYNNNPRLLASALEAYIGAFYLENSLIKAKQFIKSLFKATDILKFCDTNYKAFLQEWCQKKYQQCPIYKTKKEQGLDHKKIFYVDVFIKDQLCGTDYALQKKQAQQKAAYKALNFLNIKFKPLDYTKYLKKSS